MLHAEMTGEVSRSMLVARDEKIERIVAIVDGLAIRGDADALIAPLRMRLARMRMRRPLKFARLLFTPLDALVVPTALWSRGRLGLPRAALAPIAAECRVLLGAALGPVDALIEGCDTDNIVALRAAGRLLWPLAARALAGLAAPADWVRTSGLAVEDHDDAVRLLTGVLREAAEIEELVARAGDGVMPDARQLRPLVARVAAAGDPRGVAAVLAVLLARLPDAERVLNAAGELAATSQDKGGGTAADAAIDIMLGAIRPAGIQLLDLAGAADQLRAAAA